MNWNEAELKQLIKGDEDEHLEFKKAEGNFKFKKLLDYCVALANERGGILVLGVTDSPPRRICGTKALRSPEKVSGDITAQIGLRVVVNEISTSDGRVLVFEVPSRPTGVPLESNGRYLMRSGESLVTMTHDELRRVFDEARQDFSREIAPGVTPDDLNCEAIIRLRALWSRKSGNHRINELGDTQLLHDLGLIRSDGVTNAGLVLLGTEEVLARQMPTAEVIYEYRSEETDIGVSAQTECRIGFMLALDRIWSQIAVRGSVEHIQEGLFIRDIPVFDEEVIREALLNAVTHRDYRMQGPVFVRQFPKRLVVESPGGFPEGVDSSNLLWRQNPRNRLLAEVLSKAGLVERSGQGVDKMYRRSISDGKEPPDYARSDAHRVEVVLNGRVQDPAFLRFLEKASSRSQRPFSTEDLIALDRIRRNKTLPDEVRGRLVHLEELGALERIGRGRGSRYILSKGMYQALGKKGVYTRRRGLDRRTNMELLLLHVRDNPRQGSQLSELMQVVPSLSRTQVQTLLQKLRSDGKVVLRGKTKGARWFPTG